MLSPAHIKQMKISLQPQLCTWQIQQPQHQNWRVCLTNDIDFHLEFCHSKSVFFPSAQAGCFPWAQVQTLQFWGTMCLSFGLLLPNSEHMWSKYAANSSNTNMPLSIQSGAARAHFFLSFSLSLSSCSLSVTYTHLYKHTSCTSTTFAATSKNLSLMHREKALSQNVKARSYIPFKRHIIWTQFDVFRELVY